MSKFEKVHKIITNLFLFNAHIELNISFLQIPAHLTTHSAKN